MTFAYVQNNAVQFISSADTVEWQDMTITSVRLLTPAERKNLGIYDFIQAAPVPRYNRPGGTSYQINKGAGTVTEIVEAIPFADADMAASKNTMWDKIKAERDQRMAGGAKVGNKWFHTDSTSRTQHLGLKDTARDLLATGKQMTDALKVGGQQIMWKCMDGSFVALTIQTVFDIVEADKALDAALFLKAEQHHAAMSASLDPEGYDYTTGWPERYTV